MSFWHKIRLFNPKFTLFCIFLHMDILDIRTPPPVVYRYVGAYPWHIAMNQLIGHTRSNTQATSWGKREANGRWVASASRGGGVDERMVGGSSATRWDATTSRCEWRRGSRMDTWGGSATRWHVRTSQQKRGKWEERRQQTSGGGSSWGRGGVLRGWEAEAACWEDKRRRQRNNRGDTTTSWQTRGQREGGRSQTIGGGSLRGWEAAAVQQEASWKSAGGTSGQEAAASIKPAAPQNDERWRLHGKRMREWGGTL